MQADSALSPAILAVADSMWRARPLADGADAYSRVPRGALCRPSRPATLASRARALRCDWSLGPRTRSCALRRMRFFEYVVRFFCTAISSLSTSHGGGGEAPESAEGAAPSRLGTSRWSDADGASGQGSSAPTHSASVGPLRGGKAGAEGAAGVQVRHARNPKLSCPNADAGQWRWRMLAAATAAAAQPWRAAAAGVPRRRSRSMLSSGLPRAKRNLGSECEVTNGYNTQGRTRGRTRSRAMFDQISLACARPSRDGPAPLSTPKRLAEPRKRSARRREPEQQAEPARHAPETRLVGSEDKQPLWGMRGAAEHVARRRGRGGLGGA